MSQTPPIVLIVEDEPLVRELAVAAIQEAGLEVVEAANADEAIDILQRRCDVGVLFTDVDMPGQLDGLALARLVHEHWPAIRLILTSGRSLPEPAFDGQFVAKPYSLRQLARTVTLAVRTED